MSNEKTVEGNGYKELIMEIKRELPNIVLPLMGMEEENRDIDISGRDFIVVNKEENDV